MERVRTINPFAIRDTHKRTSIIIYRVFSLATWAVVLSLSIIFSIRAFTTANARTVWDQNKAHPTPFSLDSRITIFYSSLLLLLQVGYIYFLNSNKEDHVNAAANVGSHFIFNNIMTSAWLLLWVYGWFWIGEIPLVLNLFNLTSLYFRHLHVPYFWHFAIVSGPLAFTFVAILWNGAAMVDAHSFIARVIANIAIWSILPYGLFFLIAFKDHAFGWGMSTLSLALAVQQHAIKVAALQGIFAIVITTLLVVATLAFFLPPLLCDKELMFLRAYDEVEDLERRSLLDDE